MNLKEIKKHVTVSDENSKLEAIPSVSMPAVITCNKKAGCTKGDCYALNGFFKMPSVKMAYAKNLNTFKTSSPLFFQSIYAWLTIRKPDFFRWHVSGDIVNARYAKGIVNIAKKHPEVKFLVFTKKYNLLKYFDNCPDNLAIVMASENGHDKIVKLLLEHQKVDPSVNYNLAIRQASKNGHNKK